MTASARVGAKPSPNSTASTQADARAPPAKPMNFSEVTRSTVQPGGLPATSSFLRIRSPWSAGVSFLPIDRVRSSSGASTRSLNDGSSSLRSSGGAAE